MSAILCPDCGLPMIWMQGRWRCQCRREIEEERPEARLDLQAIVRLPEEVPGDGSLRWTMATETLAAHGLQLSRQGNGWKYYPEAHACVAMVEPIEEVSIRS